MAQTKKFTADIHVSISDFSSDDIIDYLEDEALLNEEQLNRLRDFADSELYKPIQEVLKPDSIIDVMKI